MNKRFFGTDGIRGRVGKAPITPDWLLKLGWAAGKVFAQAGHGTVLIGKDTRISGYMLESALEAGLASAGIDTYLLGPMPTPAIAYLTQTFQANAGIVISASHNPYYDNGIKFFSTDGYKLDDASELAIEAQLAQPLDVVNSQDIGKAKRVEDAAGRYIEFCKSTFPRGLSLKGMHVVLDCANGATYHIAPSVFTELGATVTTIGTEPDGLNINQQCGSTEPASLAEKVVEIHADLGIALDGDGDRVILVDHTGEVVDGDEILCMIAQWLVDKNALNGGVIGTQMSNLGLEIALNEMNIPFHRAKVGDRHVMAALKERGWILGGESSGHIINLDTSTTGDGIVSALKILALITETGQTLAELKKVMQKCPQTLVNVPVNSKDTIMNNTDVLGAVQTVQKRLGECGRVLLRPSGTESLIRVMVEGTDGLQVKKFANEIAAVVEEVVQFA